MKPQPPARRPPTSLPRAAGPDPAEPSSPSTASTAGRVGTAGGASGSGRVGSASTAGSPVAKLTIRVDPDLLGRARTAWRIQAADPAGGAYPSFGSWVAGLIEEAVATAEQRHGGRLAPTPPGTIPTSHPRTGKTSDL